MKMNAVCIMRVKESPHLRSELWCSDPPPRQGNISIRSATLMIFVVVLRHSGKKIDLRFCFGVPVLHVSGIISVVVQHMIHTRYGNIHTRVSSSTELLRGVLVPATSKLGTSMSPAALGVLLEANLPTVVGGS